MKFTAFGLAMLLFVPTVLVGQTRDTDYQLRFLAHNQTIVRRNFGLALWAIAPDVTVRPRRFLVLGGLLLNNNRGWLEVMGGELFNAPNGNETILDVRISVRIARPIGFSGELFYSLKDQRVLFSQSINVPFSIKGLQMSSGEESEILFPKARPAVIGVGPRFTVQLPFWRRVSVTNAYHFRWKRENIFRTYVFVNF